MGIGVAVLLIAAGAILTFAVHATATGISITAVGIILMIAGALGLLVTLTIFAPRRRANVIDERVEPVTPSGPVVRERTVERHDVY
jgi:uncharacterized membrane protein